MKTSQRKEIPKNIVNMVQFTKTVLDDLLGDNGIQMLFCQNSLADIKSYYLAIKIIMEFCVYIKKLLTVLKLIHNNYNIMA